MRESTTYQMILRQGEAEGRIMEARTILLRQGRVRFGAPDVATITAQEAIHDLERLERMCEQTLDVASWAEVLATA